VPLLFEVFKIVERPPCDCALTVQTNRRQPILSVKPLLLTTPCSSYRRLVTPSPEKAHGTNPVLWLRACPVIIGFPTVSAERSDELSGSFLCSGDFA
jgi:hypothetical protein